MNKQHDKLINSIVTNPEFKNVCDTYTQTDYLAEELYQEFILVILQYDKDKLIGHYENNTLLYFCIGIIKRMATSSTSPFYNKFRKRTVNEVEWKPMEMDGEDVTQNKKQQQIEQDIFLDKTLPNWLNKMEMKSKYTYKIKVFKLKVIDGMTFQQIANETSIPITSLFNAVRDVKQLIQEEFDYENYQ